MHKSLPSIEILMSRKAKEVSEISYLFHTKNSIPFSQFLRLHRLCSDDSDFPEKSEATSQFFDKLVKWATTMPNKLVSVLVFSGGR